MLLELRGSIALRQSGGAATARAPEKSAQELSIAKPRELPKHEVYALLESIAYKRKHENCSVVGNDSSMRDSELGRWSMP